MTAHRRFLVRGTIAVCWFVGSTWAPTSLALGAPQSSCFDPAASSDQRIAACTQLIESSNESIQVKTTAYLSRGAVLYSAGKFEDAGRDFSIVIASEPVNARAFHWRGLCFLKKVDYVHAIADFSEAIRLYPEYASAYNNRGTSYAKTGDYRRALADFEIALRRQPAYVEAYYNRAIVLNDMARYDDAISDLKHAIDLQPSNSELFNQLAWTYFKMGAASEGMPHVNRALELNPNYANAYDTRGAINEAMGNIRQARSDYRHALMLDAGLASSARALERLASNQEDDREATKVQNADPGGLVSELVTLVAQHGWSANMGRMCAAMKIGTDQDCKFKQISISPGEPGTIDNYGFNVPISGSSSPSYVVMFHLRPLIGSFFVMSPSGKLIASYYRAQGVDYTAITEDEARGPFEEALAFWQSNLPELKKKIATEGTIRR